MDITIGGVSLSNWLMINNIQGLGFPATRDRELSYANSDGAVYDGTTFDSRVITLSVTMLPDDDKTVYAKLDELKGLLAPYKGEQTIGLSIYPDRYIMGRYSGTMDIEQLAMMQMFPLSFKCSEPFWYENDGVASTVNLAASFNAFNKGNWTSKAYTISVNLDPNVTFTLTNTSNNKQLVLKNNTASPQLVLIDAKNNSITNSTKTQNFNSFYVSGEFFPLIPGDNNITMSGAGTGTNTITWKSCWV